MPCIELPIPQVGRLGSGAELGELPSVLVGSCGEVLVAGSRVRVYTEQGQMVGHGRERTDSTHF